MNNIKVYFNTSHLLIAQNAPQDVSLYTLALKKEEDVFAFRMNPVQLFDETYNGNILAITEHVEDTLEAIFNYAKGIVAAGGIVKNKDNKTLIIFRRGFWDLPKGKVEKGEKIINAAQREVGEETGVEIDILDETAVITYHCYKLKGNNCIKETHWYHMQAKAGQLILTPQTEEDIEQAIWATNDEIKQLADKFYPLIWALLKEQLSL